MYENDAQPVLRRMLKQGRKEGRKVSPVSVSLVPEVLDTTAHYRLYVLLCTFQACNGY